MTRILLIACLMTLVFMGLPAHAYSASLIMALTSIWFLVPRSDTYTHPLDKQLSYLSVQLVRALVCIVIVAVLIFVRTSVGYATGAFYLIALCIALVPIAIPLTLSGPIASTETKLQQHRAIVILRCLLSTCAAELCVVGISLLGYLLFQLQPLLSLPEILFIELMAVALPVRMLRYDASHHKLFKVNVSTLHEHTLSRKVIQHYSVNGIVISLIVLCSYLAEFWYHHISPRSIDASLPLQHHATTLAMVTFVACSYSMIMFERVDRHDNVINPYLFENKKLLQAFGVAMIGSLCIIYIPVVNSFFQSAPLNALDWLIAGCLTGVFVLLKLLLRHTRKHSRHEVLRLHQEIKPRD